MLKIKGNTWKLTIYKSHCRVYVLTTQIVQKCNMSSEKYVLRNKKRACPDRKF